MKNLLQWESYCKFASKNRVHFVLDESHKIKSEGAPKM